MAAKSKVAVVMVPLPSQSHLNQLLQIGALLSSRGLPVHFLGTATHNRQARLRSAGLKAGIEFHDLSTRPIDTPEPNKTSLDKYPVHQTPALMAYMELGDQIGSLVQQLSSETTRIVLIYDNLLAEAVKAAVSIPNVESYAWYSFSALHLFYLLWDFLGRPFDVEGELNQLPSVMEFYTEYALRFMACKPDHFNAREGDIYNTSRLIDGKYIDLLRRKEVGGAKRQWAIQPICSLNKFSRDDKVARHECLKWLDRQAPRSVMYVCFGSSISLTTDEIGELAAGLEQSGKKFIWVVREADKADIFTGEERRVELPEGFEERVKENGIVVRDWAPQVEILAHQSTAGFMTHCGWNSCFESLIWGVPVAAWPMHTDQPSNAIFLTEILRVGLAVTEWAKREEVVRAPTIKNVVERLLSEEEGGEIRNRAKELSTALKKSMEEDGEVCGELNSFIDYITR